MYTQSGRTSESLPGEVVGKECSQTRESGGSMESWREETVDAFGEIRAI